MSHPSAIIIEALTPFAQHFKRESTWEKAKTLIIGAVLTKGRRVVTEVLRIMGYSQTPSYNQYHHVLSRAVWSPLELARTLLLCVLKLFFTDGEALVFGVDETLERRWGRKIKARGIYRDAVRSSSSHFVKASGLRWISFMLLTPISWASRIWALPILTILAPSQRYYEQQNRKAKTMLERAMQGLKQLKRWLPTQDVIAVGDGTYAAIDFLHGCQKLGVTFITRLRWDAALYEPAPPYSGRGRPRNKGQRQATLAQHLHAEDTDWQSIEIAWYSGKQYRIEIATGTAVWFHYGKPTVPIRWVMVRDPLQQYDPIALLCTDPTRSPETIVAWFVTRWQVEVTFEEARRHLGVESQRQWSDKAIARTTPILLGLFSWVTMVAEQLHRCAYPVTTRQAAWYNKSCPTFSDALALLRQHLWMTENLFLTSCDNDDMIKISKHHWHTLSDRLSYVA